MDLSKAVAALAALAHPGRLAVFRLLVKAGEDGVAAGDIARGVEMAPQTLSGNLTVLAHAGLVSGRRAGRSIRYTADYAGMRDLLGFLMEDCCAGKPEICAPLAAIASQSCMAEGSCA